MRSDLRNIFDEFNSLNIKYFVLRDYASFNDIENSRDIDIYIDKSDLKKAERVLESQNFSTPFFNDNKFPHIQYTKLTKDGEFKFDIVYDFYYGQNQYYFNIKDELNFNRKISNYFVPETDIALVTMLFHICFDKHFLSDKNKKILINMYEDFEKHPVESAIGPKIIPIVKELIDDSEFRDEYYCNKILSLNVLKPLHISKYIKNIKIKISNLLLRVQNRLSKKSIAVIGVDGSGKSTTISSLNNILKDKSVIVYMGLKEFRIKSTPNYDCDNKVKKLIYYLLLYIEMNIRYYSFRFKNKIVIYDRYVDDIFINCDGLLKKIHNFFYKLLFPKPKIKIYMYCDLEESFKRKNDITNKEIFSKMKNRYDDYYLNNKNVLSISSSSMSEDEVVETIIEYLNNNL